MKMLHLAAHPGYMEALLGKQSGTAGIAGAAPFVSVGGAAGALPGAGAMPIVPVAAAGAAAGPPGAAAGSNLHMAQPSRVNDAADESAAAPGFGSLSGKGLSETLAWIKARGEVGLLQDLLNAN